MIILIQSTGLTCRAPRYNPMLCLLTALPMRDIGPSGPSAASLWSLLLPVAAGCRYVRNDGGPDCTWTGSPRRRLVPLILIVTVDTDNTDTDTDTDTNTDTNAAWPWGESGDRVKVPCRAHQAYHHMHGDIFNPLQHQHHMRRPCHRYANALCSAPLLAAPTTTTISPEPPTDCIVRKSKGRRVVDTRAMPALPGAVAGVVKAAAAARRPSPSLGALARDMDRRWTNRSLA